MKAKENRLSGATETESTSSADGSNNLSLNDTTVTRQHPEAAFTHPRRQYPDKISLSVTAENYLDGLAMDLVLGYAHYWQLSPALTQLWEFAYQQGRASRAAEVAALENDADRFYFEMTIRQPKPQGEYVSWADLQKRRAAREEEAASNYPGGDLAAAWGVTE